MQKRACRSQSFLKGRPFPGCFKVFFSGFLLAFAFTFTSDNSCQAAPEAEKAKVSQAQTPKAITENAGTKEPAPLKPLDFKQYSRIVSTAKPKVISLQKLKEELAQKKPLFLLDLRDEAQFKSGHLKGAFNIGSDLKEDKLAKVIPTKEAKIVIYCTNSFFPTRMISLTHVSYPQLTALGYKNVYSLEEVWQGKDGFKEFDNLQKSPLWESSK